MKLNGSKKRGFLSPEIVYGTTNKKQVDSTYDEEQSAKNGRWYKKNAKCSNKGTDGCIDHGQFHAQTSCDEDQAAADGAS